MIVRDSNYMLISKGLNNRYWDQGAYPNWTAVNVFIYTPGQRTGCGAEPHYHDCDEFWLFVTGHGETQLDGQTFDVDPNTLVYTPMGVVHRFQMFTDFENVALTTRLERQKRPTHILVEEDGPPTPTVPGFVIPGAVNDGPLASPGPRCPVTEMRVVGFGAGAEIDEAQLLSKEHWVCLAGTIYLAVDGLEVELSPGDVGLLRAGAVRRIRAGEGARVALARERVGKRGLQ